MAPSAEVLHRASEVLPLPLDDLEILRRGRVILERRLLPHFGSTSFRAAPQPTSNPASHNASPSPAAPSRGRGRAQAGRLARRVFRVASRASRRACAALHCASRGSSGRGTTDRGVSAFSQGQPCSDNYDSDNQPLLHRRRRRLGLTSQTLDPVPFTIILPPVATLAGSNTTPPFILVLFIWQPPPTLTGEDQLHSALPPLLLRKLAQAIVTTPCQLNPFPSHLPLLLVLTPALLNLPPPPAIVTGPPSPLKLL